VKFVVNFEAGKFDNHQLHTTFKLQTVVNTTSMVLFDADGCLRKFTSAEEICKEFFGVRKRTYDERKAFLERMLSAQSARLSEQARFILMKINGEIIIENKRKSAIVEQLIRHNFKPDPVKVWKDEVIREFYKRSA
jgi:DNA topoisomerase-2